MVRHPEMPDGLFRIMDDMLGAAVPTCAYLKNLARDGSAYWTFSVVIPIDGHHLSISVRPLSKSLRRPIYELCRTVRREELRARFSGLAPSSVASQGADRIEDLLVAAGYPSYVALMLTILPAEVAARDAVGITIPAADAEHPLLAPVGRVDAALRDLAQRLTAGRVIADRFDAGVSQAVAKTTELAGLLDDAHRALREHSAKAGVPLSTLAAVGKQCRDTIDRLDRARTHSEELDYRRAEVTFAVSLCRLQCELLGRSVADRIEPDSALEAASCLHPHLGRLSDDIAWTAESTRGCVADVAEASQLVSGIRSLLSNWRLMISKHGLGDALAGLLPQIDAQLAESIGLIKSLTTLATELGDSAITWTGAPALVDVAFVRDSLTTKAASTARQPVQA